MSNPTISFIISVYNGETYLKQCLDSVIQQQINKEIIIVDDGSTDNTLPIILQYQQQYDYITLIKHKNSGLSKSRNQAMALARGDYIGFVDADDFLVMDLNVTLNLGIQYDADIIRFGGMFYWEKEKSMVPIPYILSNGKENEYTAVLMSGWEALIHIEKNQYWIPALWASFIKRDYLRKYHLFFKEGTTVEDQLFCVQSLSADENCKIIEIPMRHYIYRVGLPGTITSRTDKSYVEDHLRIIELIFGHMKTLPIKLHKSIFFIVKQLVETCIHIVESWNQEERENFPYFYQKEWRDLVKIAYPQYWDKLCALFPMP